MPITLQLRATHCGVVQVYDARSMVGSTTGGGSSDAGRIEIVGRGTRRWVEKVAAASGASLATTWHGSIVATTAAVTNVVFITAVALMIFLLTCHTRGKEKSHECMSKTSVGEQRCVTKSHQQS